MLDPATFTICEHVQERTRAKDLVLWIEAHGQSQMFSGPVQLNYGEFHKIVGGHPSLGDWSLEAAPQMSWSEGDTWSADVQIPAGQQIDFKVCLGGVSACTIRLTCVKCKMCSLPLYMTSSPSCELLSMMASLRVGLQCTCHLASALELAS